MKTINEIEQMIYKSQDSDQDRKEFGSMPYCTIPFRPFEFLKGRRDTRKRFDRFGITRPDIEGKTVIDIGCNIGGVLFESHNLGCAQAVGVEHNEKFVAVGRAVAEHMELGNRVGFIHAD
ncbi:unnamed protein product, partial [marine sediment metagenome]